jgi:hypothetical protein
LADLITQFFIKNIDNGATCGRALLEARQKFLSGNGPHLDPYELKTLAQFYLLGDPSVRVAIDPAEGSKDTLKNHRIKLFEKGLSLAATIAPCEKVKTPVKKGKNAHSDELKKVFKATGFTGQENEAVYEVKSKNKQVSAFAKGFSGTEKITYRTLIQKPKKANGFSIFEVLVIKESGKNLLGWWVYHRKSLK